MTESMIRPGKKEKIFKVMSVLISITMILSVANLMMMPVQASQDDGGSGGDAGDSFATATQLSGMGDYTGELNSTDQDDYYNITLTDDHVYWINCSASESVNFYIYDSSQSEIDSDYGHTTFSFSQAIKETNHYFLRVENDYGGDNPYHLNLTDWLVQDDANTGGDAGDGFSSASHLNSTGNYTGFFEYDGDRYDYYSVNLTKDYVYWFNGTAGHEIDLEIYDPSQNSLDSDLGYQSIDLCVAVKQTGTFYVKIGLDYNVDHYGHYDLNITEWFKQDDANTGQDAGDDFSTSAPLNYTGDYSGFFEYDNDRYDYYSVNLTENYIYWFNGTAEYDIELEIFDPSENLLNSGSGYPSSDLCLAVKQTGTFYVKIGLDYNVDHYGRYDLNITEWFAQDDANTGHDAGDNFSAATPLSSMGDYNGFFEYDNDRYDYYSVNLTENYVYWFNGTADYDIELEIFDPSETLLDSGSGSPSSDLCVAVKQTGTFYVKIGLDYNVDHYGQYELNITEWFAQDDANTGHDAGDNFSAATPLNSIGDYSGFFEYDNDQYDYYSIDLTKDYVYWINGSSNHDIGLKIYDSSENQLDGDYNYNSIALSLAIQENGTYYVEIYVYSDTYGDYNLNITERFKQNDANTGHDAGDSFSDATSLNSTGDYEGFFEYDNDRYDYYSIDLNKDHVYWFNGSSPYNDIGLKIYDSSQNQLDGYYGDTTANIVLAIQQNDTYYVEMYIYSGGSGYYDLNITDWFKQNDAGSGQDAVENSSTEIKLSTGEWHGYLEEDGDEIDFYSIDVSAGNTLYFNLTGPKWNNELGLYNSSMVEKAYSDTSYSFESILWEFNENGTWYIRVRDDTDTGTYTLAINDANNSFPEAPSNPSPTNGAEDVVTDPTLSVNVSDPDGDAMTVTFYNAYDDSVIGQNTGVTNGTTSIDWNGLSTGTTYDWYVIADDGTFSEQSPTWSFTTLNDPPGVPTDPNPANGAQNTSTSPMLSVNVSDPNNDTLDVTFYDASDNTTIGMDYDVVNGGTAYYEWTGLSQGTMYEWYAVADDGTNTTQSPTWSFNTTSTNSAPEPPANPSPADGSTNIELNPTLSVDVSDPDGDAMDVSFYDGSDDSLIDTDSNVASGNTASVTWSGLSTGTSYSWYALADDGTSDTASIEWNFTTDHAPLQPSNPSPMDGATGVNTSLNISVDVSDPDGDPMDVTFYNAHNDNVIDTESGVSDGGTASVIWSGLMHNHTYEWYAVADDGQAEIVSNTWNFTTVVEETNQTYNITINEFLPDPDTDWNNDSAVDSGDEFIELYNEENFEVNISGWYLDDIANGGTSPYQIPSGTSIQAGGFLAFYKSETTVGLNNEGDNVRLLSENQSEIENHSYSSSTPGESYIRLPDGHESWYTTTVPTPGAPNELANNPPNQPMNPSPSDGEIGTGTSPTLSVDVSDPDGDSMNVTFFNASGDSEIGTDTGVSNDSTASVTWSGLTMGQTYNWYAVANDSEAETQSTVWSFTTEVPNSAPEAPTEPIPLDGATDVSTSPTLSVNVTDPDGDTMTVTFYNASNDSVIGSKSGATNGTTSVTWSGLAPSTTYEWYAVANDSQAETQSATWSFTTGEEDNQAPTADAGDDRTVDEDTPVTFNGSGSSDNVDITDYTWTIEGSEYSGVEVQHTFNEPGSYTVTLNVSDSAGNSDTDTANITVEDVTKPTADAGANQTAAIGEQFNLNASGSSDNVGIVNYTWTHDGNEYYGIEISQSISDVGNYQFVLNVTDETGNYDTDTVNITVEDQTPPEAVADADKTSVNIGESIQFDASGSSDNVNITGYSWDFGDEDTGSGETVTHSYGSAENYTVTLTVSDAAGNTDTDTLEITVEQEEEQDTEPPIADAGNDQTVNVGENFALDASDSSDNVGIVNYTWTVEGEEYYGEQLTYSFSSAGNYTITVQVSDAAGNTDSDVITITVEEDTDGDGGTDGKEGEEEGSSWMMYLIPIVIVIIIIIGLAYWKSQGAESHEEEGFEEGPIEEETNEVDDRERMYKQDGTGPHGRGEGPGEGRADGTGLEKETE